MGGRFFTGGEQCNMTTTSWEHCSRLQQSCCHAVVEDSVTLFAAYTSAVSQCFSTGRTIPKLPLPVGGSRTPSNTWFLGPTCLNAKNAIWVVSAGFAQLNELIRVPKWQLLTDRQSHRPRYVQHL